MRSFNRMVLLVALACIVALGAFAAGTEESSAPSDDETKVITWMNFTDITTNNTYAHETVVDLLQEAGWNVEIDFKPLGTTNGTEWGQKFVLEIAAGTPPADVMQLGGLVVQAVQAGYLAEIDLETVAENMPVYYASTNERYPGIWAFGRSAATGELFGVPSYNMFGAARHTFVYRQDWLDTLGLDIPQTIDDFEEWLVAVREGDPNGNGQPDEYGYTTQSETSIAPFSEVFAAYGVMPLQWMVDDDGSVVRGEVHPRAKEALAVLADWYERDLLPRGVMTTAKVWDDFFGNRVGTLGQARAYAPALVPGGAQYEGVMANPGAEIAVVGGFEGPYGDYGTWAWGPKKYLVTFGSHLNEDQDKLAYIMQMLDFMVQDEEIFVASQLGEEGVHWEWNPDGGIQFTDDWTDRQERIAELGVLNISSSGISPLWIPDVYEKYLHPDAVAYGKQNPGMWDVLLTAPPSSVEYSAELNDLTKETIYNIVTGAQTIDAFDEFVETWYDNGGEILTREANALYDTLNPGE